MARSSTSPDYPDDIFAETRMTFGEHLEELRMRLIKGLIGLVICLFIGFILDAVGKAVGNDNIGIGRPMLAIITYPVESQVRDFYNRRAFKSEVKVEESKNVDPAEAAEIEELVRQNGGAISKLTREQLDKLRALRKEVWIEIPTGPLVSILGPLKEGAPQSIVTKVKMSPAELSFLADRGEIILGTKQYLSTLSAQEAFVVYFKVSILCGVILSCPWLLYQFWAFVGAGLYPHERRHIKVFFWPSVILFLAGVLLCQFIVLPGALKALLVFNEFLGFDPDIRLNEWLGLALVLPLVFGVSFQTPLLMIFLNRIGVFSAKDYASKWRYACMIIAFFAAVITPTPDVVTMSYMFVPMFGLYLIGIVFCHYFPGFEETPDDEPAEEEVAV